MVRWCWVNFQCRGVLQFGYSRARAYCARSRCGWGLFGHFYTPLSFLSSFSLSLETARYRLKYRLKGPLSPKQPTNQLSLSPIPIPPHFSLHPAQTPALLVSLTSSHYFTAYFIFTAVLMRLTQFLAA